MRVILDTSILIGASDPGDLEGAISSASLAELHFGLLVAGDADEQARRAQRLAVVEATFEPIPIDAGISREWGRLAAAVAARGGRPRRRMLDLVIAATANISEVPLLTADGGDFAILKDLVEVRAAPADG